MGREEAHAREEKVAHEGGSTRTKTEVSYDLIPGCASRRLAKRYYMGSLSHGRSNWKSGGKDFILATLNHLEKHLNEFKEHGNAADDNLGAIAWGAAALMWFEENKPEEMAKALAETR